MSQPATTTTPAMSFHDALTAVLATAGVDARTNFWEALEAAEVDELYRDLMDALEESFEADDRELDTRVEEDRLVAAVDRDPQKLEDWLAARKDPVKLAVVALRDSDQHLDKVTAAFEELARRILKTAVEAVKVLRCTGDAIEKDPNSIPCSWSTSHPESLKKFASGRTVYCGACGSSAGGES